MHPGDFLKDCHLKVWEATYSVIQARAIPEEFVAIIKDYSELTIIAKTGDTPREMIIKEEQAWKMITFEAVLPFELVGFLAVVSKVLAEEKISIFALSAYSTDHIMVKANHLDQAIKKLQTLGCKLSAA